jgi:toxin YoeB
MRSIVFEGNTWNIYEDLRLRDKVLHKNLCKILKEMQRENPEKGIGKPEQLKYEL